MEKCNDDDEDWGTQQTKEIFSVKNKQNSAAALMGFYVIEARRMPFADESGPRAADAAEFDARNASEIRSIVMQNPAFFTLLATEPSQKELLHQVSRDPALDASTPHTTTTADEVPQVATVTQSSVALVHQITDRINREMMELEGLYCATIDRMAELADEECEEDDDERNQPGTEGVVSKPKVAMRFDELGYLVTMGILPHEHGYHE